MSLVGFLAKKQHGKDTASDYLVKNYNYKKLTFAKPIKDACEILFGFTNEQLYGNLKEVKDEFWGVSPRNVFQYIGTDVFRKDINKIMPHIKDNFWINNFKHRYKTEIKKNSKSKIVVADVRFQNEVDIIHELSGKIIKIYRPNMQDTSNHISENAIDNIKNYDILIKNNGTIKDLHNQILDTFKVNLFL